MLHQIALFSDSAILTLVYLDSAGAPHTFTQNATGVWANATAPGPIPSGVTFKALSGLANTLFAMDQNGKLWSIAQDNTGKWNSAGFQALPNSAKIAFTSFGVASLPGLGIVVCGAVGNAGAYTQSGPLQGPLSQPAQLNSVYGPNIAVAATTKSGVPTAVVLGTTAEIEINMTTGAYSTDGVTWHPSTIPQTIGYPILATLASGNAGTLQAIILNTTLQSSSGLPNLLWDSSGNGSNWSWYGQLPNSNSIAFSQAAAANGNNGNLQVVGIDPSNSQPYFIWQDASNGNWMGCYQLPYNGKPIVDLAIGKGGQGSQGYLQVGYLGNDGKVYLNYQDLSGAWYFYGPLP